LEPKIGTLDVKDHIYIYIYIYTHLYIYIYMYIYIYEDRFLSSVPIKVGEIPMG